MNISKGMSIEDYNLLQVAREFYQDSKFTHDIAQKGLNERFADSKISLSPKSLGERKRLDDMVVKNLRDMNVYMDVVQEIRDKYFGERFKQLDADLLKKKGGKRT